MTTHRRERFSRRMVAWAMLTPLIVGLAAFSMYPLLYLVALSLSNSSLGSVFRRWVGLDNFAWALSGSDGYVDALLRTLLFALVGPITQLVLGTLLGLMLLEIKRGGTVIRSAMLLPLMTPPVLVGVAWKLILAPGGGLLNGVLLRTGLISEPVSYLGSQPWATLSILIADTWQWTPFMTLLAYAAFSQVPQDIREAATLDGARPAAVFWRIVLPLAAPALVAVFLLRVIMAFKTFDILYVLTFGGPGSSTSLATFAIWQTALQNFDIGQAAAQTLIFGTFVSIVTLPIVWLYMQCSRYL